MTRDRLTRWTLRAASALACAIAFPAAEAAWAEDPAPQHRRPFRMAGALVAR